MAVSIDMALSVSRCLRLISSGVHTYENTYNVTLFKQKQFFLDTFLIVMYLYENRSLWSSISQKATKPE
jgi:hypothetical protein